MKGFIIRLLCFATTMAAFCCGFEFFLDKSETKAGGTTARTRFIDKKLKADILVFGSSRALHHYDPIIMKSILHHTVYNCGEDKMGIIFNYGRYRIISQRYTPKIIVYDVEPDYDLLYDDNTSYLSGLRRYQKHSDIRELFIDVDPWERFKTRLMPYRLNNRIVQTLKDYIAPADNYILGYSPYVGCMKTFIPENLPQDNYDSMKFKYLKRIVAECNGQTQLIFTASPQLSYKSDSVFVPLKEFCEKRRIPFINHFCDTTFTNHPQLFHNANHLEKKGAEYFSLIIAKEIRNIINHHYEQNQYSYVIKSPHSDIAVYAFHILHADFHLPLFWQPWFSLL